VTNSQVQMGWTIHLAQSKSTLSFYLYWHFDHLDSLRAHWSITQPMFLVNLVYPNGMSGRRFKRGVGFSYQMYQKLSALPTHPPGTFSKCKCTALTIDLTHSSWRFMVVGSVVISRLGFCVCYSAPLLY
jgi:hypothetical protein